MSEAKVTLTATYDEMDFLFNESCYSHPQIPYFGIYIKSFREIFDEDDDTVHVDRNKLRRFRVIVRNEKARDGAKFVSALSFIKHLTTAEKGRVYEIPPHVREREGYAIEQFINGADLSDEDITDLIKHYKADLQERKYPPHDMTVPIRKAYNQGIDEACNTDLDADGRQAFVEGYYQGAAAVLNDVADFIALLKDKERTDRYAQQLKDELPMSLDRLREHYKKTDSLREEIATFIETHKNRITQ